MQFYNIVHRCTPIPGLKKIMLIYHSAHSSLERSAVILSGEVGEHWILISYNK